MRVRKKVLFLHTLFFLGLAAILLVPLRPAITEVVEQAEISEARLILRLAIARGEVDWTAPAPEAVVSRGSGEELGLDSSTMSLARANPGRPVGAYFKNSVAGAVAFVPTPAGGEYWLATVTIPESRRAVLQLYLLTAVSLLAVYALVAAALELFVLPQHVYGPIGRMLDADLAVQEGNKEHEIIADSVIPADELGEIMRSRNRTVQALRRHEAALAEALTQLEVVATDLKRKNHLLEAAQRNLADADRLASLGMMSAGIAHELNTPLAVLKGLVEKLNAEGGTMPPAQAALMLRVVRRLERLGESLLDFARARPPQTRPADVRTIVEEAATLVRLDRERGGVGIVNDTPPELKVECDSDRMVQVMVNLLRNSCDAIRAGRGTNPNSAEHAVRVAAEVSERDGREWVSITVTDEGPGIDAEVLTRLFEPFASTRLDAHGTGLGLAVAEGIVRAHGGLILARNRTDRPGAIFEVMLPVRAAPAPVESQEPVASIQEPR